MSLHILVGYPGQTRENPAVLYCGDSRSESERVRTADTAHHRFEVIDNPTSYRKSNPHYAAPLPVTGEAADPAALLVPGLDPVTPTLHPRRRH